MIISVVKNTHFVSTIFFFFSLQNSAFDKSTDLSKCKIGNVPIEISQVIGQNEIGTWLGAVISIYVTGKTIKCTQMYLMSLLVHNINVPQCAYEQTAFHGKQLNFSLSCFTGAPHLMYLCILRNVQ